MKKLQKVIATEDGDGHWLVIPHDRLSEFIEDRDSADGDELGFEKFDGKWGKYYTGGDLNNIQLYAEIDE
jgi:hypothetical protein